MVLLVSAAAWGSMTAFTPILFPASHLDDTGPFPRGPVARIGGEKVLLLSAVAWGSMTAFTPILAHFCSQPVLSMTLARFLVGLLQGVHYPSLASLCSQKVVESERGFLMSTVGSGSYLGTLVIGGAGSLMLDLYGWESVFYVSGLLSVLWAYCMWKYLLKGEGPIITLESLGSAG
uniref:solute carrier family 17 member 9-like n=1 Tax=Monopterus albus TaxID=43700 RepID=UPI0009B4D282